MEIAQIVGIGLIGTILSVILKKQSSEFSLMVSIVTGIIIFILICSRLGQVILILKKMADEAGVNTAYLGIVLKIIGISYIAQFGVQLCTDAGESSIASKIELAGKVLIMVVSIPIMLALLEMVTGLVV